MLPNNLAHGYHGQENRETLVKKTCTLNKMTPDNTWQFYFRNNHDTEPELAGIVDKPENSYINNRVTAI